MSLLLLLPLLVPLLTAAAGVLWWRYPRVQRTLASAGAALHLASAVALLAAVRSTGIQAVQLGRWPAPFGITFVADLFSAVMVVLAALLGGAVLLFALGDPDEEQEGRGFYPVLHLLLTGVCGAFLTGDLFNLFVWFEVLLIASFVLLTLDRSTEQLEGGVKYVALNLVSSALFLAGVGLLYGMTGTLNMADLSVKLSAASDPTVTTPAAVLLLAAFGIKAAMFPLFFWLPASYHTAPIPIGALFAGLLTKVGVYSLIRVFTVVFVHDVGFTHSLLLVLAGFTMVTGVLGAVAQTDLRRLLSFHIISQVGYLLMGLALLTPLALLGAVYFMMHIVLAKAALFLVAGVAYHVRGTSRLDEMGGLYAAQPALSLLFLLGAASLAGIPPFSGFFGKLALVQAGIEARQFAIVGVALGVSLLTLYSMAKVWTGFWTPAQREPAPRTSPRLSLAATTGVIGLTLLVALAAQPLLELSRDAADQLLDPAAYIEAVLGGVPSQPS